MKIILIGSSTGGPRIIFEIFADMPVLSSAVIIVQHMPASTTPRLARRLTQLTKNEIIIPDDQTPIRHGCVFLALGDKHLTLENNELIHLNYLEKVNFVRPSIDVAMLSLYSDIRHKYLGIILTGMGIDGAQGLSHMKEIGATTVVQDPATCTIRSMPDAALKTDHVDLTLQPDKIRELIKKF
jgi:two-component system chemotaxis response regulator CheB